MLHACLQFLSRHYTEQFGRFLADLFGELYVKPLEECVKDITTVETDMDDITLFKRHCLPLEDLWHEARMRLCIQETGFSHCHGSHLCFVQRVQHMKAITS